MATQSTLDLLRSECKRARVFRGLYLLPYAGLGFGVPALLFGVLDLKLMLMEQTAWWLILVSVGVGLVSLVQVLKMVRNRSGLKDMAHKVEREIPELMDSLVCAFEISESRDRNSPLDHALIERVNGFDRARLTAAARAGIPCISRISTIWVLLLVVLGFAHFMPLSQKFRHHAMDLLRGKSTALTVTPGTCEVAEGDAVTINVTVHRGPREQVQVMVSNSAGQQSFRMTEVGFSQFEFTVYGIAAMTEYQVVTPIVQSRVYTISPYKKPEFDTIRFDITPPAYTGVEPTTFDTLGHRSIPQGSQVTVTGAASMPLTAYLVDSDGTRLPFTNDGGQQHTVSFTVDQSDTYQIVLEDNQGHQVVFGDRWDIEMIEDLPPVIKVVEPEKETSVIHEGHNLPVTAEVTDDYGVHTVSLVYNINGGGWKIQAVRDSNMPAIPLALVASSLDLSSSVSVGDVVLFYLEATDKAEPKPNVSRSVIRFVEVRPKPPEDGQDNQTSESGQGNKKETLRVDDLIMRAKALIRDMISVSSMANPADKKEAILTLRGKASDLHLDTSRRYEDIKKKAAEQDLGLGVVGDLFVAAVEDLKAGQALLDKELVMEAVSSEQGALANLIKIAIELEKNTQKRQGQGQGEQTSKSQSGKQQSKDQQQKNAEKQQREALENAKQMLSELRELVRQEQQLRDRMADLKGRNKQGRAREEAYLADTQREVADKTEALRDRLSKQFPNAQDIGINLDRAKLQMHSARRNVASSQPGTAEKYAGNAVQFLERARSGMEQLRDSLTSDRLSQAIGKLSAMQAKQKHLQGAAGQLAKQPQVDRNQAKALSDQQNTLNKELDNLLQDLAKAGAELEQATPGTEDRMQKAIRDARESRIGANMKRAANALRYRRPGRALEHQKDARSGMEKLAKSLSAIQKFQGQLSMEELSKMLEKTMGHLNNLKQPQSGDPESRQEMARDLREMARRMDNKTMKNLSGQADQIMHSSDDPTASTEMSKILSSAARVLERELLKAALRQKIRLSRAKGQQAPGEYRKLVEEYFKILSQDEEE